MFGLHSITANKKITVIPVKWQSNFNGADGSAVIPNQIGTSVTVAGGAQLRVIAAKFGTTGLYTGTTSAPYTGISADFDIGSNAFTLECWVYKRATTTTTGAYFLTIGRGTSYGNAVAIGYNSTGKYKVILQAGSLGASIILYSASTYPINTWHHIAVTRETDGAVKLWIDGALGASGTYTNTLTAGSNRLMLNGLNDNNGLGNSGAATYKDEVRFTLGVAQYTSAFSVPTEPFPTSY